MAQQVPTSSLIWLVITAVLLLAVPVIYCIIWRKKTKFSPKVLIAGMLGFMVSARILEMIPHMFCIVLDNPVSRFINGNIVAYVLYGILMAGIFEECGRYVIFRFILKKDKSHETSITYGIGHGGFEVLIISFAAISNSLTMGFLINSMGLEAALPSMGVTEATKEAAMLSITPIYNFGAAAAILTVFERIVVMGIHIALSVIVFYGVRVKKIAYLFLAIAAHAILDVAAALSQKGVVSILVCEVWLVICMVVLWLYTKKLYSKMKEEDTEVKEIAEAVNE